MVYTCDRGGIGGGFVWVTFLMGNGDARSSFFSLYLKALDISIQSLPLTDCVCFFISLIYE